MSAQESPSDCSVLFKAVGSLHSIPVDAFELVVQSAESEVLVQSVESQGQPCSSASCVARDVLDFPQSSSSRSAPSASVVVLEDSQDQLRVDSMCAVPVVTQLIPSVAGAVVFFC